MFYAIVLVTIAGYTAGITDQTRYPTREACEQHIETVLKPAVAQLAARMGVSKRWNEDEMANHGTAFASRHKLARERVEAIGRPRRCPRHRCPHSLR